MFGLLTSMLIIAVTTVAAQESRVPADARATIAAANVAWLPALRAHDAAAIAAPYADNGVFVTPNGAVVSGRDGVAQLMRERFAKAGKVTAGELVQDGITRQGMFIYEWGHAVLEIEQEGGAAVKSRGRYLTVWQRSAAGRWQIVRNLSLPD